MPELAVADVVGRIRLDATQAATTLQQARADIGALGSEAAVAAVAIGQTQAGMGALGAGAGKATTPLQGVQQNLGRMGREATSATGAIAGTQQGMGGMSAVAMQLAAKLGMVGISLGGLATAALGAASQMGGAFKQLKWDTGLYGTALQSVQTDVTELAKTSHASFGSIGAVIAIVRQRTGQTGESARALAGSYLDVAHAAQIANAAGLAATGIAINQAWDQGADSLDKFVVAAQQTGDIKSVSNAMSLMDQYGANLRNIGMTFDESLALIASFTAHGRQAEPALAALKMAIGELGGDPKKLGATVKRIQDLVTAGKQAEAIDLAKITFGGRGMSVWLDAIQGGVLDTKALQASLVGAAGASKKLEDTGLGAQAAKLGNQALIAVRPLGVALIDIAKSAIPALELTVKALTPLAALAANPIGSKLLQWSLGFGMLRAAIGPVAAGIAGLVTAGRNLATGSISERLGAPLTRGFDTVRQAAVQPLQTMARTGETTKIASAQLAAAQATEQAARGSLEVALARQREADATVRATFALDSYNLAEVEAAYGVKAATPTGTAPSLVGMNTAVTQAAVSSAAVTSANTAALSEQTTAASAAAQSTIEMTAAAKTAEGAIDRSTAADQKRMVATKGMTQEQARAVLVDRQRAAADVRVAQASVDVAAADTRRAAATGIANGMTAEEAAVATAASGALGRLRMAVQAATAAGTQGVGVTNALAAAEGRETTSADGAAVAETALKTARGLDNLAGEAAITITTMLARAETTEAESAQLAATAELARAQAMRTGATAAQADTAAVNALTAALAKLNAAGKVGFFSKGNILGPAGVGGLASTAMTGAMGVGMAMMVGQGGADWLLKRAAGNYAPVDVTKPVDQQQVAAAAQELLLTLGKTIGAASLANPLGWSMGDIELRTAQLEGAAYSMAQYQVRNEGQKNPTEPIPAEVLGATWMTADAQVAGAFNTLKDIYVAQITARLKEATAVPAGAAAPAYVNIEAEALRTNAAREARKIGVDIAQQERIRGNLVEDTEKARVAGGIRALEVDKELAVNLAARKAKLLEDLSPGGVDLTDDQQKAALNAAAAVDMADIEAAAAEKKIRIVADTEIDVSSLERAATDVREKIARRLDFRETITESAAALGRLAAETMGDGAALFGTGITTALKDAAAQGETLRTATAGKLGTIDVTTRVETAKATADVTTALAGLVTINAAGQKAMTAAVRTEEQARGASTIMGAEVAMRYARETERLKATLTAKSTQADKDAVANSLRDLDARKGRETAANQALLESTLQRITLQRAAEDAAITARNAAEDLTSGRAERAQSLVTTTMAAATRFVGNALGGAYGEDANARATAMENAAAYTTEQQKAQVAAGREFAGIVHTYAREQGLTDEAARAALEGRLRDATSLAGLQSELQAGTAPPWFSATYTAWTTLQGKLEELRADYEQKGIQVRLDIAKASFDAWKDNVREDFSGALFDNAMFQQGVTETLKKAVPGVQIGIQPGALTAYNYPTLPAQYPTQGGVPVAGPTTAPQGITVEQKVTPPAPPTPPPYHVAGGGANRVGTSTLYFGAQERETGLTYLMIEKAAKLNEEWAARNPVNANPQPTVTQALHEAALTFTRTAVGGANLPGTAWTATNANGGPLDGAILAAVDRTGKVTSPDLLAKLDTVGNALYAAMLANVEVGKITALAIQQGVDWASYVKEGKPANATLDAAGVLNIMGTGAFDAYATPEPVITLVERPAAAGAPQAAGRLPMAPTPAPVVRMATALAQPAAGALPPAAAPAVAPVGLPTIAGLEKLVANPVAPWYQGVAAPVQITGAAAPVPVAGYAPPPGTAPATTAPSPVRGGGAAPVALPNVTVTPIITTQPVAMGLADTLADIVARLTPTAVPNLGGLGEAPRLAQPAAPAVNVPPTAMPAVNVAAPAVNVPPALAAYAMPNAGVYNPNAGPPPPMPNAAVYEPAAATPAMRAAANLAAPANTIYNEPDALTKMLRTMDRLTGRDKALPIYNEPDAMTKMVRLMESLTGRDKQKAQLAAPVVNVPPTRLEERFKVGEALADLADKLFRLTMPRLAAPALAGIAVPAAAAGPATPMPIAITLYVKPSGDFTATVAGVARNVALQVVDQRGRQTRGGVL